MGFAGFSSVEPAERGPEKDRSGEEDGAVEVTRKPGAFHRAVETVEPAALEPADGDGVFAAEKERGSEERPEEHRPEEVDEDLEETRLKKSHALRHGSLIRRNRAEGKPVRK